MDSTSSIQATATGLLTTIPLASTIFEFNTFEFWSIVIGTISSVFGVVLAVLVFILGLQVWQQNKLREKAEEEYKAIRKIAIEMSELKNKQQELFDSTLVSIQKQAGDVVKMAGNIKALVSTSKEEKKKIEKIKNEIEQKANELRGSAISLGTIAEGPFSVGAISVGVPHTNLSSKYVSGSSSSNSRSNIDDYLRITTNSR